MTFSVYILFICFALSAGLLIYILLGYPILIAGLAMIWRHPVQKKTIFPTITIVIPTHNEECVITQKLDNILGLEYPRDRLQVIVCDDASGDRTAEFTRKFASNGYELSEVTARAGKASALNRGLALACGEIFVITDADIMLSQNSLRELIANFADETVGCVVAQTLTRASGSAIGQAGGIYWRYESFLCQNESELHSTVAATGHLMGLRRKIIQPIPTNLILDDFYLAMMTIRQGYRVISEPKAIVWENPIKAMDDELIRRRRLAAGRYQVLMLGRKYFPQMSGLLRFQVVSHKFLRLGIPYFMFLALAPNLLLAIHPAISSFPFALRILTVSVLIFQGIFYLTALIGKMTPDTGAKKSKLSKIFMLPYFICATNFASLTGLYWYLSGRQTVLWEQAKRG